MSAVASEAGGWSRRRWRWIVTGGVAVHGALIFWLGERRHEPTPGPPPNVSFLLVVDGASSRAVGATPVLTDPTLFALPSHDGFSGAAWLALPPAEAPDSVWTEPPRYLPLDTNELGGFFTRVVATNKHSGQIMEDVLKPRATTADILLFHDPVMTQSVVRLEGLVAQRPLLAPLRAPNPPYPDVLPDTVVQLKVNADGHTESAILLAGCGAKNVDEQALAVAKSARFQPLWAMARVQPKDAANAMAWGRMVFQWFTVLPAATNNAELEME